MNASSIFFIISIVLMGVIVVWGRKFNARLETMNEPSRAEAICFFLTLLAIIVTGGVGFILL